MSWIRVFSLLICLGWALPAYAQEESRIAASAEISPSVRAFMKKHCVDCHAADQPNEALRFDVIPTTIGDEAVAQRWQDILDTLNLDQMPPKDAPQPSQAELSDALETLTADLAEARTRLTDSGGQIVLRRLNRREYQRTIAALFGVPVEAERLPEDGRIDGFDTLGQAHGFSSLHLERYLELGRSVLDQVIVTGKQRGKKPKTVALRSESEGKNREFREELPRLEQKAGNTEKAIAGGRKEQDRLEITRTEIALSREYLARPENQTGALIPFRGLNPSVWVSVGSKPLTGRYRVRVQCGAASDGPADDLFLKVVRGEFRSKVPDAVDYYQVSGTVAAPRTIEFFVDIDGIRSNRLTFERRHRLREKLPQYAESRDYFFKYPQIAYLRDDARPDLWIDRVEIEGPLPTSPPPLSAEKLFAGNDPAKLTDDELREVLRRFTWEAFRHQAAEPGYIEKLLKIQAAARDHGVPAEEALKESLAVVLASPRFLFLHEPQAAGESRRPLTDRELAVRLAYFLWSAPPDGELYQLAEAGTLRDPAVLAEQVDRMLASERSATFVETFASQWLQLERLNQIDPDATATDTYDDAVQRQSKQEVFAFFATLLRENLPVTNLVDSDFVVVNGLLARFYELPGVNGDEFRKVAVAKGSVRGGLLGQSAILTLNGTGDRTSPVERGAFVLRKLLDRPPPPAPANVPMLDEGSLGNQSIRETLAQHMTKAQCQSCHRRIDPLGFALENFDPVGRWRTEVKSRDGTTTFPIEPAGLMPDGKRKFADFPEMKQCLVENRDDLLTGLTEALMTYALGRTIGFGDRDRVEHIVAETAGDGYGLRTLIHCIVRSDAFLSK
jgi:hypothetical protein